MRKIQKGAAMGRIAVILLAFLFGLGSISASAQTTVSNNPIQSYGLTCTGSVQQLPAGAFQNGFVVIANPNNAGTIWIGGPNVSSTPGTGGLGYPLAAGQPISYGAGNSANASVVCTNSGDTLQVTGN